MVIADAVHHGFEHHDAHETLLDPCGDVFVHSTAPYASGKEQHQQVALESNRFFEESMPFSWQLYFLRKTNFLICYE